MKWPLLQKLLEDGFFSYIDLFFAKTVLGEDGSEEEAALLSYLMAVSRMGHLCIKIGPEQIEPSCKLPLLEEKIRLGFLKLSETIAYRVTDENCIPSTPVCIWQDTIYLQRNFFYETKVLRGLQKLQAQQPALLVEPELFFSKVEALHQLNPQQKEALHKAYLHSLSFICGGPGTGKTFTASFLLGLFSTCSCVAIAAPTGKAVAHLKEKIGHTSFPFVAKTLHSLLGIHKKIPLSTSLPFDLLIVDEASMIDVKLMAHLLAAVKEGARLVFLGDPDQLPPVDAGSIFADMVKQAAPISTFLDTSMRFEQNALFVFSKALQQVNEEKMLQLLEKKDDPHLRHLPFSLQATQQVLDYAASFFPNPTVEKIDPKQALQQSGCFRLLSCLRMGPTGVDALNAMLLQQKKQYAPYDSWIAIPLLITDNDNVKELYNGMSGVAICHLDRTKEMGCGEEDMAYFSQGDAIISIPCLQLPRFEWAYCISVHKSQGSEYDHVVLVVPPGSEVFGREILYTAATRARQTLELIGSLDTIMATARQGSVRTSGLAARLKILG